MRTIEKLAARGINVGVNVAPVIPGLNDEEIGKVLEAAKNAGARRAGWVLLRLPGPVLPVFESRLHEALPLRAEKVLRRIRETRDGKMYDSRFGSRQRGEGVYAETIAALFQRTAAKLGLATGMDGSLDVRDQEVTTFSRPALHAGVAPPKNKRPLALF